MSIKKATIALAMIGAVSGGALAQNPTSIPGKVDQTGPAATPGTSPGGPANTGGPADKALPPSGPAAKSAQESPTVNGPGAGDQGPIATPKQGTADPKALPGTGPKPKGS